jgi:hypothetical protein
MRCRNVLVVVIPGPNPPRFGQSRKIAASIGTTSQRGMALRLHQSKAVWCMICLAAILALHGVLYGAVTYRDAMFGALFDSRGYLEVGEALWSGSAPTFDRLAQRGYVYPLIGGGLALISPAILFLVQASAVCGGVWCLLAAEETLAGRITIAPLALLSVSLLLSPSHLMTEAFAFTLAACALLLFLRGEKVWPAVTMLIAAACIKPALAPVALISVLFGLARRRDILPTLLALLLLVGSQVAMTSLIGGRPVFNTAAASNFSERFYPAVTGAVAGDGLVTYRSDKAVAARALRPELTRQVAFVLSHPLAAARMWAVILWDQNLVQPSGYLQKSNGIADGVWREPLSQFSLWLNTVLLMAMIPTVAGVIGFLRAAPARRWVAPLIGLSIFSGAPLTYYQGDRIIFIAVLLMLPFAGLGIRLLSRRGNATREV